jgi:hypothetical protein
VTLVRSRSEAWHDSGLSHLEIKVLLLEVAQRQ